VRQRGVRKAAPLLAGRGGEGRCKVECLPRHRVGVWSMVYRSLHRRCGTAPLLHLLTAVVACLGTGALCLCLASGDDLNQ
jgi:hypothetical protein